MGSLCSLGFFQDLCYLIAGEDGEDVIQGQSRLQAIRVEREGDLPGYFHGSHGLLYLLLIILFSFSELFITNYYFFLHDLFRQP